jgi:Na+/phosphate symporter
MTVVAIIPVLVAVVGLLLNMYARNSKVQELGRIMFFCGTIAFCFSTTGETVSIGRR